MGKKSSGGVGLTKSISLGSLQNIGEQQQQHQTQQQSAMPPSNMKKSISLAYLLSRGDSKASATSPSSGSSSTTSPNSDVVPAVSELVTSCEQVENETSSLIASDAGAQTRVEQDSAAQDVPEAHAAKPEAEERISKLEQELQASSYYQGLLRHEPAALKALTSALINNPALANN